MASTNLANHLVEVSTLNNITIVLCADNRVAAKISVGLAHVNLPGCVESQGSEKTLDKMKLYVYVNDIREIKGDYNA